MPGASQQTLTRGIGDSPLCHRVLDGRVSVVDTLDSDTKNKVDATADAQKRGWQKTEKHGWVCPEDACREEAGLTGRTDEEPE